jgi:hypothetical protein
MTEMADPRRRWDTDDRFTGVADASAFAAAIDELAALARCAGWVAEEPEAHLVPHLRTGHVAGLRLAGWSTGEDGVLDAVAEYRPGSNRHGLRRQDWALIGTVAELAASVRERADGDTIMFEVVTGIPGNGHFATHGHALRLTLRPADTRQHKRAI